MPIPPTNTLIDTHCHINALVKPFSRESLLLTSAELELAHTIINNSINSHVTTIINVGTDYIESCNSIELAKKYPAYIKSTVGLHPTDVHNNWREEFLKIKKLFATNFDTIVGVGETGLDFYHPDFNTHAQIDSFKAHIELALEYNRAVVIHSRNAHDETLKILEEYRTHSLRAVLHCFSGDITIARTVYNWGYVLGIGGTVTYPKNNELRTVCTELPLNAFVLETDAPFLPPQGFRGTQNSPAHIRTVAQYLADLRGVSLEAIATGTTTRAKLLFALP